MSAIISWFILAVVTERLVIIITHLLPFLDDLHIKRLDVKLIIALVIGLIFSFGASLNFFTMFDISFKYLYVGEVVSALFIMAGSNYVADLVNSLRNGPIIEARVRDYVSKVESDISKLHDTLVSFMVMLGKR